MIRAGSSTAKALAVAIAGAEIVSPLGFGAAAQEVKTAAATRPECVNPKGAWVSTCAIVEVRRDTEEQIRRGAEADRLTGCLEFLKKKRDGGLALDKARLTREAACGYAKDLGMTGGPT